MLPGILIIPTKNDRANSFISTKAEEGKIPLNNKPQTWLIDKDIRLDLLYKVGLKATSGLDVARLINDIVSMSRQALGASSSSILLLDEKGQFLYFKSVDGAMAQSLTNIKVSVEDGITGWVVRHRKPLIINDVSKDDRFYAELDKATGFITRSIVCAPLIAGNNVIGVIEVLNKMNDSFFESRDLELLVSLASTAAISIENACLHQHVLDGYKRTVNALAAAIDAKDPYTCGHSQRVRDYALMAGKTLSLPSDIMEAISYAGVLHDVGKIGIVESTLCKTGSLNTQEWATMRDHPAIGAVILGDIPFLEEARDLVLFHHERFDGNGYPNRLKKEDIPLGARLIAVADAFDTMVTDRAYRPAQGVDYALNELNRHSGTQFCPIAVEAFITAYKEIVPNMTSFNYLTQGDRASM